ncbi:hypothetical protein ElyMa_001879700 [Elysia marginata]|uniref:Uncharacterized protein n=1 Tax=Elysia marginata TaxID=1093978 RepID=A0AAV4EQN6_9GAST|nr:hypothetical protein ElyMa_001879700 [Elysia marginata]
MTVGRQIHKDPPHDHLRPPPPPPPPTPSWIVSCWNVRNMCETFKSVQNAQEMENTICAHLVAEKPIRRSPDRKKKRLATREVILYYKGDHQTPREGVIFHAEQPGSGDNKTKRVATTRRAHDFGVVCH